MPFNSVTGKNVAPKTLNYSPYAGKPIIETVTNGFFTVDHKWIVKYWNKSAEKLLHVNSKDIVGKNIWEQFAAKLPPDFYKAYHKAFLKNMPVHFNEYWAEMKAWFDVITYYCDGLLSVSFKSSTNQSTSAIQKKKEKIYNELYRFVIEFTNECLWEWDLRKKEQFWIDGGHQKVFGYEIQNALVPQSFWECQIHPMDKVRVLETLDKVIAERNEKWEIEFRFKKADGSYADIHDRGYIIYEGEKAMRIIGVTHDISERKIAEMKMIETEKKLSLIAKQTTNAIIVLDADEKISWVNNAFTNITEYALDEVVGSNPESFLQGQDTDPETQKYLSRQMKEKQPFDCEILNFSKSGRKYWMRVQGQPLFNDEGICDRYFAIQTDITDKVMLENQLALERQERQKEITNAVLIAQEKERADIGKEMHDNLTQILGAAKLYLEMADTHEKNRHAYLLKSSGYIVDVIEEIRKISKILIPPGLRVRGLSANIKILIDDLEPVHAINIDFFNEGIDETLLSQRLQVDIFRMVQEQMNNILKHGKASHAIINLTQHNNKIILLISDNGIGCKISKERKGVGILNITSRAELYNGTVSILSNPGEGYELKVVMYINNDPL